MAIKQLLDIKIPAFGLETTTAIDSLSGQLEEAKRAQAILEKRVTALYNTLGNILKIAVSRRVNSR